MLPADAPKLFSSYASSCAWRVRIALRMKKVWYDYVEVNMARDVQLNQAYHQLNPIGQVPVLKIDGQTLMDSTAIMYYLDETRPLPPLMPIDTYQRTVVRQICGLINAGIQPLQNKHTLKFVEGSRKEWVDDWITRCFNVVEKIMAKSSGLYCVGSKITMADLCLLPQVHKAVKFGIDMEPYPNITRVAKMLDEHKDFDETRPEKQPDYPPEVLM